MIIDSQMNQGTLLKNVEDVQMRQGICYALSTEWCLCMLKNKNFDLNSEFYRMVSRQRAYNLTYADKIKNLTKSAKYQQFFQTAEPPSYRFMQDQAKHEGITSEREVIQPSLIINQISTAIEAGKSCIFGFFGVDKGNNWGHATAIGCRDIAGSKPRFFDPNQGQFSWSNGTKNTVIAKEILANIHSLYNLGTIRNCVLYKLS